MAEHIKFTGTSSITVDEVLDHFNEIDPGDQEAHLRDYEVFASLYNDRKLVSSAIMRDLEAMSEGRSPNMYSQQSTILGARGHYSVRANIWSPIRPNRYVSKFELSSHSYLLAHDHNFNFFTIGYAGPGYRTRIYEYDRQAVSGFLGEKVDMRHLCDVQLQERDVIYFRDGRDIHIQHEPEDYSITVNLLVTSENISEKAQYYFDVDARTILDHVDSFVPKKISMIELASSFLDENTAPLFEGVIENSTCPYTAAAAANVLGDHEAFRSRVAQALERVDLSKRQQIESIQENGGYIGRSFDQLSMI